MMKRRLIIALTAFAVIFIFYVYNTYGVTDKITKAKVDNYTTPENTQNITEKVLEDTGYDEQFDSASAKSLKIYFGNIISGESNDILINVGLGENYSLLALYTLVDDKYEYVDEVGMFSEISSIQIFPINSLGRDIFFVNETSNQLLGAFESDQFLKGYGWFDGKIKQVLNTTLSVLAYWYNLWDDPNAEPQWTQILQTTDFSLEDGAAPVINLERHHTISLSSDTGTELQPQKCCFVISQRRTVDEKYYWDKDWGYFILGEKIEKATNKPVAILEDYSSLPYALIGADTNKYRILRDNGEIAVVPEDSLV